MRNNPPLVRQRRHTVSGVRHALGLTDGLRFGPRRAGVDHAVELPAEVFLVAAAEASEIQLNAVAPHDQARRDGDDVLRADALHEALDRDRGLTGAPWALGQRDLAAGVNRGQDEVPGLVETVIVTPGRRLLPGHPGGVVRIHRDVGVHGQQRQVADLDRRAERSVGSDAPGEDMEVVPRPCVPGQPHALTGRRAQDRLPGRLAGNGRHFGRRPPVRLPTAHDDHADVTVKGLPGDPGLPIAIDGRRRSGQRGRGRGHGFGLSASPGPHDEAVVNALAPGHQALPAKRGHGGVLDRGRAFGQFDRFQLVCV